MKIGIVGTGYVGLVTGACLADFGHEVTCVDKMEDKIARLLRGELPIYEPGLESMVTKNVEAGRLHFTTSLDEAVRGADAVFIAVGTPTRGGDGHADLSHVYEAAREVAGRVEQFTVIATKSTVPVGTADNVERIVRETNPDADIVVVSNPEFLREGAAITDFKLPDRIVIGVEDDRARDVMAKIYRPLYLNQAPLFFTSRRTAELIKYTANAFLAMKITFINEIAELCERVGAHVQEVAHGIGMDRRIGPKFLHAGPGYGGSCLPKDTLALAKTAEDAGSPLRLVETTIAINAARKRGMARKVTAALGGDVRGRDIAVLGVTFKPNTDDLRDAPALPVIQALIDFGANVTVYDPEGMAHARTVLPSAVSFADNVYDCATGAEAIVIMTEWEAFRALDFQRLKQVMRMPVLVDLRNIYRREEVEGHGFAYTSVGRPAEDIALPADGAPAVNAASQTAPRPASSLADVAGAAIPADRG